MEAIGEINGYKTSEVLDDFEVYAEVVEKGLKLSQKNLDQLRLSYQIL